MIPPHPNSKPLSNLVSDPGKIKKFGIFKVWNKLYELSFKARIDVGKSLANLVTSSALNKKEDNFSKLYKIILLSGTCRTIFA